MGQVSGVAMGLDRVQMLLMGAQSLEEVMLFPLSKTLQTP
ncbi:MAG: amino acid--tRNA ligase-related protein [Sphaerochaeta sp.]